MKKIASLRKGRFALIFSLTFIAGVLLTTILLLAGNSFQGWCSKQFSLTTWNVADVEFNSYHDILQIESFQDNISDNITVLQEDFFTDIYNGVKEDYNYGETSAVVDGLSFLSQFYIGDHHFQKWSDCSNIWNLDCLKNKGFACAVIYIPVTNLSEFTCKFPIHVYTLHADAGDSSWDIDARRSQFDQLSRFMDGYSKGYSVIVAGDFNLDSYNSTYNGILELFKYRQQLTMANNPNHATHIELKTFDYILFRAGDDRESLEVTRCNVDYSIFEVTVDPYGEPKRDRSHNLNRNREVEDRGGNSGGSVYIFSDHFPVKAHFNYSVNYDAFPDLVVSDILQVTYDTSSGKGRAFVRVKNNGPAAIDNKTKLHIECYYQDEAPSSREYRYRGEMRTPDLKRLKTSKCFLGSHAIPPLNSGKSTIVEVSLNNLNNYKKPYRQSWKIDIIATANKPRAIRENNELNNILVKRIDVVQY